MGSSAVAPLPPPPEPVPIETISRGRWSGVGWLSIRMFGTGPILGETPARPTVIALGFGVEGGWRIRQWVGVGMNFSRQPHEVYEQAQPDTTSVVTYRGAMSAWDIAFVRLYAPVRGRIDPFLDVGAGLALYDPARSDAKFVGATIRASLGFEAWIARNLTLGVSGMYRLNLVDESIGHAWQAALDFGIHW